MKKQLQLRGISRSPSDRMNSDGGCSESLNVQLIEGETAPVLAPEDITSLYGPEAAKGLTGPALFIHKGLGYNNLIFLDTPSGTVMAYKEGSSGRESAMSLYTLQDGETINKVTSVGNTVILCTNQRMEYALYKEGKYKDLGDQIPVPQIEFRTVRYGVNDGKYFLDSTVDDLLVNFNDPYVKALDDTTGENGIYFGSEKPNAKVPSDPEANGGIKGWNLDAWSAYLNARVTDAEYKADYKEVCNRVWEMLNIQKQQIKRQGLLPTPVFVRYALKLYDGSYIYQSVPILVGAGDGEFFAARGVLLIYGDSGTSPVLQVSIKQAYSVTAHMKEYNYDGWEDIVDSIELFLSTDIHYPLLNSEIKKLTLNSSASVYNSQYYYDLSFSELDDDLNEERKRSEILSKSNFYLIDSFRGDRISKLTSEEGYNIMSRQEFISQDYLVTQPTLPDDYQSNHRKIAGDIFQYNNKTILTGVTTEITSGYPFINGATLRRSSTGEWVKKRRYRLRFHLRDSDNNDLTVICRNADGGDVLTPFSETYDKKHKDGTTSIILAGTTFYAQAYCWLAYPDSRCYRVDVEVTIGEGKEAQLRRRSYEMEAHPMLNCSFVQLDLDERTGIDNAYVVATGEDAENYRGGILSIGETREYTETNVIWASAMDNPFVYPAEGKLNFVSEVLSIANATAALSEGQFGQYPLYVFTKDGIWSVPVSDAGDFAASVPMSRDVALSKDSIQTVEQAITFATAQGVMLLQGSSVTCISPHMEGEHYVSPADLVTLLGKDAALGELSEAFSGDTPFKAFLRSGCKTAFDYAGRRVFFFTDSYTYLYRIESQTWHKLSLEGEGVTMNSSVNSYPDCYVCCKRKADGRYLLYDFSVEYSDDPAKVQKTLPGLIVTRALDLDLPDVRKTITGLRIRGHFNRKDVQYILLGSMDGLSWGILPSLRGGSYKLYRIALVLNLAAGERVSWIDVEYEERLNNRMR